MYPRNNDTPKTALRRLLIGSSATAGLALALVLILAGGGMTSVVGDLRLASDAALIKVQKAVADEDSETLASVFTENGAITVPSGQTIRGRTTIRSMGALMMMTWGGGNLKVTRDTLDVRDSTGHEIGQFVFRRSVKDQPDQVWSGDYTVVWEKEAGAWKISRVSGMLSNPKAKPRKPDGN